MTTLALYSISTSVATRSIARHSRFHATRAGLSDAMGVPVPILCRQKRQEGRRRRALALPGPERASSTKHYDRDRRATSNAVLFPAIGVAINQDLPTVHQLRAGQ
jgi:hypothetical protein